MRHFRLSRRNISSLCDKAYHAGNFLFFVSVIELLSTIIFPVKSGGMRFENFYGELTSVIALVLFGFFLRRWAAFNLEEINSVKDMKIMKALTLLVSLACLIKAGLAAFYCVMCFIEGDLGSLYYIGETIFSIVIFIFFISYYRNIVPRDNDRRMHLDDEEYGVSEDFVKDYDE